MYKLNKKDMEFIAGHCNNVYPNKHKYTAQSIPFGVGHINGYVLKTRGAVYVFIAGTDEFKDVITDLRVLPSHFNGEPKNIKVHIGFESAYRSIKDILFTHFKNEYNIIVAGHSMGGAIATLLAYKLAKTNLNIACVTFGSPRVGNRAFTKTFNKTVANSYRLVYKNDAVTKVPYLLSWYRHVGKEYQSKGKRWFSFFGAILDHPMQNYIDGIKNNMWRF